MFYGANLTFCNHKLMSCANFYFLLFRWFLPVCREPHKPILKDLNPLHLQPLLQVDLDLR